MKKIHAVCICVLFLGSLMIGFFLACYSAGYSYYSSVDYNVPIYPVKDHVPANLLVFLAAIICALGLDRVFAKFGNRERAAGYFFLGCCCTLYIAVCLTWVAVLPYYPSGDQLNATAAAYYHLNGNFIMLTPTGYLGKFPYQKGLAFLYEILFALFGDFCYGAAAKIHILLGVFTMVFGYLFVEEISTRGICKILYALLVLFCAPYLILTPYTYGDLPSICFCTVLFWVMTRYARTGRFRYVPVGCGMAVLSVMVRLHAWIVLLAVFAGMFLRVLYRKHRNEKRFLPVFSALLIMICAYGGSKILDYSYALRSGYEISAGAPMVLTMAMGLQNNGNGPGTYNNYQTDTLNSVDYDNAAAARIARENIRESVGQFAADPSYAGWFFKAKLLRQWTEPSFETLKATHSFDENKPMAQWVEQIYYGDWHDFLICFADRYQSVIYLGFLFSIPVLWKKREEYTAEYIPLISIAGGFLFSIIWESQCRYVLPYYLFMLLYVPEGLCFCGELIKRVIRRSISFKA